MAAEISISSTPDTGYISTDSEPDNKESDLLNLPEPVILHLMKFLDIGSLVQLSLTCKQLNETASDPQLWERLDLANVHLKAGELIKILKRNPTYLRLACAFIAEPEFYLVMSSVPNYNCYSIATNLSYLDLTNAQVQPHTLTSLVHLCQNLTKLSLEGLTLGSDIFIGMGLFIDTLNLCMTSNIDLGSFRAYLKTNKMLTVLNISWVKNSWTSAHFMTLICSLPSSILQLDMSGYNQIMTNLHLAAIVSHCKSLEVLNVSDNYQLTGPAIYSISKLENLRYLNINRCCKMGLIALEPLRHMKSLQRLGIYDFTRDERTLKHLRSWLRLEVNTQPFQNIGRPTYEFRARFIWKQIVSTIWELRGGIYKTFNVRLQRSPT